MGMEQDRSSGIGRIEGFGPVVPVSVGIGRPTSDIFEIHLPDAHGRGPLQELMDRLATLGDALMGLEDAIHRATGGNGQLEELQGGIPLEIVADRLLTTDAAQTFWGLIPN